MKIKVTEEHIAKGRRGCCERCPVALAIREMTPCESVRVSSVILRIADTHVALPWHAGVFVTDYDQGRPVQPFEFELPRHDAVTIRELLHENFRD